MNMTLSKFRTTAVKLFLTDRGVDADKIKTLYYGENKPIATNDTEEGRAKNRRVELTIYFEYSHQILRKGNTTEEFQATEEMATTEVTEAEEGVGERREGERREGEWRQGERREEGGGRRRRTFGSDSDLI